MNSFCFHGIFRFAHDKTRVSNERRDAVKGAHNADSLRSARTVCSGISGVSLLELLVSIAVLSIICGAIVSIVSSSQQSYLRTERKTDLYENVRGVADLMSQEIGQAGLTGLPASTLLEAVPVSTAAQIITLSSTTSMFVGEQLLVDAGMNNEEVVTLTAVTPSTISGVFGKPHVIGAPVNVLGVFPNGIVPPGTTDGSTANTLNIYGDLNGDGSLVYVRYVCTPGTSAAPGTLTRSVTTILPGVDTLSSSQTLFSTVVGGAGAGCFQYTTAVAGGYTFVTNVGFSVSVQATRPDPETGVYAQMPNIFLNFVPRNLLAGLELANAGISNRLQANPPNVLVY
jgi:type II secretory pathway pseudopilin PulG